MIRKRLLDEPRSALAPLQVEPGPGIGDQRIFGSVEARNHRVAASVREIDEEATTRHGVGRKREAQETAFAAREHHRGEVEKVGAEGDPVLQRSNAPALFDDELHAVVGRILHECHRILKTGCVHRRRSSALASCAPAIDTTTMVARRAERGRLKQQLPNRHGEAAGGTSREAVHFAIMSVLPIGFNASLRNRRSVASTGLLKIDPAFLGVRVWEHRGRRFEVTADIRTSDPSRLRSQASPGFVQGRHPFRFTRRGVNQVPRKREATEETVQLVGR